MRPGLASLTFNDLPIDASGLTTIQKDTATHTQVSLSYKSLPVKKFTKQLCKAEFQHGNLKINIYS